MYSIILFFIVSINGDNLNWFDSASKCSLANLEEINTRNITFRRSWIGGYYTTSSWMAYKGCYSRNVTEEDYREVTDNSPVKCNDLCNSYDYFALKISRCICMNDTSDLARIHTKNCSVNCSSIKCDLNAVALFISSKGLNGIKPNYSRNQKLLCTVGTYKNGSKEAALKAANCQKKKGIVCQFSHGVRPHGNNTLSYEEAKKMCDIAGFNKTYRSNRSVEFWTNIHRYYTINWINNSSEILNITTELSGVKHGMCVSAERSSNGQPPNISPQLCNTSLPSLCSFFSDMTTDIGQNDIEDEIRDTKTEPYDFGILSPDVYALQLVFVICLSLAVLFLTTMSLYTYRKNHRRVELATIQQDGKCFKASPANVTTVKFANNSVEHNFNWDQDIPPIISQKWHQMEPQSEDATNTEKPDENNYHHIDFTMQSDAQQTFVGDQYGVPTTKTIAENDYEHPWGLRSLNILSNIRQNVRKGTNAVRNSFFKPQSHVPESSRAEEVAYMDVKIDHQRFMYDSPNVDTIEDHSTC